MTDRPGFKHSPFTFSRVEVRASIQTTHEPGLYVPWIMRIHPSILSNAPAVPLTAIQTLSMMLPPPCLFVYFVWSKPELCPVQSSSMSQPNINVFMNLALFSGVLIMWGEVEVIPKNFS